MTIVTDKEKLSIPCKEVTLQEGLRIAALLLKELDEHDAAGLAANQIGEQGRVFILNTDDGLCVYINPVLVSKDKEFINEGEGCLSFPGIDLKTFRYSTVQVKDLLDPKPRILDNLTAVAFQHELDHLNGITFFTREFKD